MIVLSATVVLATNVASGSVAPIEPDVSRGTDQGIPPPRSVYDHDDLMFTLDDIERRLANIELQLSGIESEFGFAGTVGSVESDLATICRALDTFC